MRACDGLWGKEVTMAALVEMGKDLGLEAGGKRAPSKRQPRGPETP
jgi:hypothetical protein